MNMLPYVQNCEATDETRRLCACKAAPHLRRHSHFFWSVKAPCLYIFLLSLQIMRIDANKHTNAIWTSLKAKWACQMAKTDAETA